MKNKLYIFILLFLILGCSSDDDGCVGIDCLPEATQTGAGTFGCLVNGEPFVDNSGDFNCFYQLVDGEYYFNICGLNELSVVSDICLRTNKKEIFNNQLFNIETNAPGNFFVSIGVINNGLLFFDSSSSSTGFINITKFITNPNIVSAEFEFTVTDPNTGKVYEITEGRFDAQFNQ